MFKKKNNIILILLSVIITTFFLGCTKASETEPSNFPLKKEVGNYIIDIEYTKYFGNYLLTKYYITTKDGSNIDGIINSVEFRYRPSYLGGSIDPLTLGINDISKLNSSSFNNDIFTHFYSYNTATEKDGTSFAKEWFKNKLGSVKAAVNKTSYDGILGKTNEQINSYLEDSKEKGYSENGSIYYPELGKDAYWVDFI